MATDFNAINRSASINPTGPFPLDKRAYFESKLAADNAIKNAVDASTSSSISTYYIGQTIVVYENNSCSEYIVVKDKDATECTLERVGPYYGSNNIKISPAGVITAEGTLDVYSSGVVTKKEESTTTPHYLTFVDSNNDSEDSEKVYTTSKVKVNPSTGALNINGCTIEYSGNKLTFKF